MSSTELALLAGLGAILFLDRWPALHTMVSRPIVVGPLVGLVLGAPAEGALWGAAFEAAFLGVLPVGAARTPDAALAALVGTVVALTGRAEGLHPAGLAVAAAFAAARLGEAVDRLHRGWNGRVAEHVRRSVAGGDFGAPGRAVAGALARGAGLGALQTALALGAGLLALRALEGTAWAGWLPAPAVGAAALAMAAAEGLRLFVAGAASLRAASASLVAGIAAGAALGAWLAA